MSRTRSLRVELPPVTQPIAEVDDFIEELATTRCGDTCNFYSEEIEGATNRRENLRRYLTQRWDAPLVLAGLAPGRKGARQTGVPFTSQWQLLGSGIKETSSTRMRGALELLDAESKVIMWSVVPFHPFEPDSGENRDPTRDEFMIGNRFLQRILRGRPAIAVGRDAEEYLSDAPYVRHPRASGIMRLSNELRPILARLAH